MSSGGASSPTAADDNNSGYNVNMNKNVNFAGSKRFMVTYVVIFAILRYFLFLVLPIGYESFGWTILHLGHCVTTFFTFHWTKSSPDFEDQGQFYQLTWWEQLDAGRQFTRARKFLTFMPILTFMLASYESNWLQSLLIANSITLLFVLVPKFHFMHQVRLMKINED